MSRGTPVAALMFVGPRIEVKAVKGDALRPYRDGRNPRAHLAIESIFVHAQIRRCVPESNESGGCEDWIHVDPAYRFSTSEVLYGSA